ncbi:MAG: fertility inhibition FinO-like protein [Plectolyngbya sp. WJT66-NPBG17]|jgi:hypothetical protein|nr:fertility inhibition FinO-like protein [Plectolyngbya sp. WJT66-NPBG17]
MPAILGGLDPLTIQVTQLPDAVEIENGWRSFTVDVGAAIVTIEVRPRIWNNWVASTQQYAHWRAIITGRMGELTDVGFVLEHPGIQVFEVQPNEEA